MLYREDDVSQTLYKDTLKISENVSAAVARPNAPAAPSVPKPGKKESKINKICDAFLSTLQNRIETNLQNLITAHVCKSPPDMEAGLGLAAGLRGKRFAVFYLTTLGQQLNVFQHKTLNRPKMRFLTCVS
jgi:hypothetical protein